jgi:uncharacterized protein (TIGR00251 family)
MALKITPEGLFLPVKITPKARQNKILGWENECLKIHVTAPPEKGEANQAVVDLLAKHLKIAKNRIVLVKGSTCRQKLFLLEGISSFEIGSD